MDELTTKQKCEKLAKTLEVVVSKLRDPAIGVELWHEEELTIQLLIGQITNFLAAAKKLSSTKPTTTKVTKTISKKKVDKEEWPDIIS